MVEWTRWVEKSVPASGVVMTMNYRQSLATVPHIWSPAVNFIVFGVHSKLRGSKSLTIVQIFASISIILLVSIPAAKLAVLLQIAAALECFQRIHKCVSSPLRNDSWLDRSAASHQSTKSLVPDMDGEATEGVTVMGLDSKKSATAIALRGLTILSSYKATSRIKIAILSKLMKVSC